MSENSDAVIVVVSEETGTISVAVDGKIFRNFTPKSLGVFLNDLMINDKSEENQNRKKGFLQIFFKKTVP